MVNSNIIIIIVIIVAVIIIIIIIIIITIVIIIMVIITIIILKIIIIIVIKEATPLRRPSKGTFLQNHPANLQENTNRWTLKIASFFNIFVQNH